MNFEDELDLFRNFFNRIKHTGYLLHIVKDVQKLSKREPNKLFERNLNYKCIPQFVPVEYENDGILLKLSSKVTIKCSQFQNRFVESTKSIKYGETICVERIGILTETPNTTSNSFNIYRCHYCVQIINYFVTCPYCDVTIYCSYSCRDQSWYECHVWECYGLQRDFWCLSSCEYLAMRILFMGVRYDFGNEDFETSDIEESDVFRYRYIYKYINDFSYNIKDKSDSELEDILVKCVNILVYLIECTKFFVWCNKLPKYKNLKPYDMYMYIGGLLIRHYLQAERHRILYDQLCVLDDSTNFVSAGIFISETIFPYSCKPNAIFSIRNNYVTIKATESIPPGKKITVKWHATQGSCFCKECKRYAINNSK